MPPRTHDISTHVRTGPTRCRARSLPSRRPPSTGGRSGASGGAWRRRRSGSCCGTGSSCCRMPARPIATIVMKNRRALFGWVADAELNFGEAYMFGAVDIRGDLVALLAGDLSRAADRRAAAVVAVAALERRARRARERPRPLRPRQRLLPALARSRDGLHVRVFPDAGGRASRRRRSPRWTWSAGSSGCARATASSKPAAGGARWRCSWPSTTASPCARSTSRPSRLPTRGIARRVKASPAARSSSKTTTATSPAPATRSCRSACSSTSACRTSPRSDA